MYVCVQVYSMSMCVCVCVCAQTRPYVCFCSSMRLLVCVCVCVHRIHMCICMYAFTPYNVGSETREQERKKESTIVGFRSAFIQPEDASLPTDPTVHLHIDTILPQSTHTYHATHKLIIATILLLLPSNHTHARTHAH